METLTTLKVLHVAATVVILASGLVLAALTWRNRSEGPASTMQRPWLFIWCLMLIGMLSMPFTGWWLVHLIGWPLGQFWILGSSVIYAVATFSAVSAVDNRGGQPPIQSGAGHCKRRRISRHCGVDGGQAGLRLETESTQIAGKPAPTGIFGEHRLCGRPRNLWELACQRWRHQSRRVITGQPRFSASARKFGSGSTATGFATCSSSGRSFIESL